jgi:DNA adenine methylase
MGKYNCEKCGKEFKQKSHYTTHANKKNPCVVERKLKEMIDNAIEAKLSELNLDQPHNQQKVELVPTSLPPTSLPPTSLPPSSFVRPQAELLRPQAELLPPSSLHRPQAELHQKPILKWVGGKTQIIDKLIAGFPPEINNYHEPFLGGGSVLFALLSHVKRGAIKIRGNIYAYDLNGPLIHVYKNIQMRHNELYDMLQQIIAEFNECGNGEINRNPATIQEAKIAKENYYYWIRSEYNKLSLDDKQDIIGSAMFIFLNKTCFRGVFRVGPRGFNVPYGHYNNPEIINKNHLQEIHDLIQNVIFECSDFNASIQNVEPDDFVYLDPPYAPETDTSFVGYTENGFNIEQHNSLFRLIHNLTDTHKKIMLSNADVSLVRENFKMDRYNTSSILCKRSINSKNPEAKAREVIITNY